MTATQAQTPNVSAEQTARVRSAVRSLHGLVVSRRPAVIIKRSPMMAAGKWESTGEIHGRPGAWFESGIVVEDDLELHSPDAEFIIDTDFYNDTGLEPCDLIWKKCMIPVRDFRLPHSCLADHMAALRGGCTADELNRLEGIRQWMRVNGGVVPALAQSPLLVTLSDGRAKLEDGYHRLGIAVYDYGLQEVCALCADLDAARQLRLFRHRENQGF